MEARTDTDKRNTAPHKRPVKLLAPIYNGVAAGLALVFVGNGVRTLLMEWRCVSSFFLVAGGLGPSQPLANFF
jgi:hypothetical protein